MNTFECKKFEPEEFKPKRFVKQVIEFDERTKRMIRAADLTRRHLPWLLKVLEPIAKRRGW